MTDVLDLCDVVVMQTYFLEKFGFQEPFGLELLLLAVAVVAKYSFVDIAFFIHIIAKLNLIKDFFGLCPECAVRADLGEIRLSLNQLGFFFLQLITNELDQLFKYSDSVQGQLQRGRLLIDLLLLIRLHLANLLVLCI